jgi:hypothetical protein
LIRRDRDGSRLARRIGRPHNVIAGIFVPAIFAFCIELQGGLSEAKPTRGAAES